MKSENLIFLVWRPDHDTSWLEFTTTPPEGTDLNLEAGTWRYVGESVKGDTTVFQSFPIGKTRYRDLREIPKGKRRGTVAVFDRTDIDHLEALFNVSLYLGMASVSSGGKQPRRRGRQ